MDGWSWLAIVLSRTWKDIKAGNLCPEELKGSQTAWGVLYPDVSNWPQHRGSDCSVAWDTRHTRLFEKNARQGLACSSEPSIRDCSIQRHVLGQHAGREEKGGKQGQMGPQKNSFTSETHSISSPCLANANSNTCEAISKAFYFLFSHWKNNKCILDQVAKVTYL